MTITGRPLNGTKTHPLSEHALGVLETISRRPVPRQQVNAGVIDRLNREQLIEEVQLPSPYKVHKGRNTVFLAITDAGSTRLREWVESNQQQRAEA